jgi:CDP-diacylglycerol--glycerol-3-phosphate 3-phosphatidyltransferase
MYHTPNLTGLRKKHIPRRINEGWGLQHMKLYGIDDEIILSGYVCDTEEHVSCRTNSGSACRANLSNDYFTNRQDRYHVFSSREITDYFHTLHRTVSSLSFLVKPSDIPSGFKLAWPEENPAPSPVDDHKEFVSKSTALLRSIISAPQRTVASSGKGAASSADTSVFVLSQLSQLLRPDTSTELPAISHVLKTLSSPQYENSSWTFTAGYFNPAPSLTKLLLSTASRNNTVITASPYANGFYNSPGVSGLLPGAYTLLARRFVQAVYHSKQRDATVLKEWRRGTVGEPEAWTYHAKGLWVTLPNDSGPSISLIGSSNYTKRSYSLDLEANAMIVTENEGLRKRLAEEQQWLQDYASVVTRDDFARTERRVGLKVRVAMFIVQLVGGAL